METFIFEPVLAKPLLAALWLAAALCATAYALWRPTRLKLSRRLLLAALHFVPLAGLILLLHGPSYVTLTSGHGAQPVLAVFVDASASMAVDDGTSLTRFKQTAAAIQDTLPIWARDFEVKLNVFDGSARSVEDIGALMKLNPTGAVTDLAAPLNAMPGQSPKPALGLLFSDGIHNASSDIAAAARGARAAGIPLFTVAVGSDLAVRDLGVVLSSVEELAFAGQKVRVPVTVTQTGFDNSDVIVELREKGKVIDTRKLHIGKEAELQTEFALSSETAGLFNYEIGIPPHTGEAVISNNTRRVALRVVADRIAILFLEGKPYWDSKFLVRVLRRDPNVLLTTAVRVRGEKVTVETPEEAAAENAPGKALPVSNAAGAPKNLAHPLEDAGFLSSFQVVLLGRDTDAFLTPVAVENLRAWVANQGGHLICTRGRPVSETNLTPALAALLPVAWRTDQEKHLQVKLTERGRALALFEAAARKHDTPALENDSSVALKSLPSLVTATSIEKERSLTVVLARGEAGNGQPMAMLSVQNYGNGKAVVMEGQGLWRWGFRPPDDPLHGEDIFRAFWSNMIRWLAGSNDFLPSQWIVLRAGKPLYYPGEKPLLYVLRRESKDPEPKNAALEPAQSYRIELRRLGDSAWQGSGVAQPVPRETNLFQAELDVLEEGCYTARLAGVAPPVEAAFEVLPPLRERLDLRARPELLEELSRATDGAPVKLGELRGLRSQFRDYLQQHKPGSEIKRPAWDLPAVLACFFIWCGAAWWTRRRWGAI